MSLEYHSILLLYIPNQKQSFAIVFSYHINVLLVTKQCTKICLSGRDTQRLGMITVPSVEIQGNLNEPKLKGTKYSSVYY